MKNLNTADRAKRKPLTIWDRQYILQMNERGLGVREIGRKLGRNHSVVSRVLSSIPYSPYLASLTSLEKAREMDLRAKKNRCKPRARMRLKCREIVIYVEEKLLENSAKPKKYKKWTPELIAGRLSIDHPEYSISHESIYQWIYKERRELIKYLPIAGSGVRQKRANKNKARYKKCVADTKTSIDKREEIVESRERFGDWEGDSVVSRQSTVCILGLVERKSRYLMLNKLSACNAENAEQAITKRLSDVPRKLRFTITVDNGGEFANHKAIDDELGIQTYFCHPGSPEERGTVENRNRFVRIFFPKKTDFANISEEEIKAVEDAHNHRPMKCLGFRTPYEVYWEAFKQNCDA